MAEILIRTETYAFSRTISQETADNIFEQLTGGRIITDSRRQKTTPPVAEKKPSKKTKGPTIREKRVRKFLEDHKDETGYIDMTKTDVKQKYEEGLWGIEKPENHCTG
jgi:hypothetical protein